MRYEKSGSWSAALAFLLIKTCFFKSANASRPTRSPRSYSIWSAYPLIRIRQSHGGGFPTAVAAVWINGDAVQVYNYSVGRIVSLLQSTGKLSQAGSVTISTGARGFKLAFTSDVKDFADTQSCHFIPADELAISGKDYAQRVRRDGDRSSCPRGARYPVKKRPKAVPDPGKNFLESIAGVPSLFIQEPIGRRSQS